MPVYGTSSSNRQRFSADGTVSVYCRVCKEYIGIAPTLMGSATCELCRRVQNGEVLTKELIEVYRLAKRDRTAVTGLYLASADEEQEKKKEFTFRSLGGILMQAAGLPKKVEKIVSKTLARTKRRERLLGSIKLGDKSDKGATGS